MTEQILARKPVSDRPHARAGAVRLCIAAPAFYPVYAGPAVRFTRYLPGFGERGLEVNVLSGTPDEAKARMSGVEIGWSSARPGEWLPAEEVHGVPIHRVRLPDGGRVRGWRRAYWFHRRLVEHCRRPETRSDVVQMLSSSFIGIPALLRLRRLGVATVFTRTMLSPLPANPLKRAILRQYLRWPLEAVDCVVVSSSVMRAELREMGVRSRVEVIPNGVDTGRFRPAREDGERWAIRERLGIGRDAVVILFVGPISPRKRVDRLLEAWCRIAAGNPDTHLVLVGPRRDLSAPEYAGFHGRIERLVEGSGAADRVHFVGLVREVEEYMRAADVFAFTSRREGMPNVVPEAMAAGLPVLTTPFIGLPDEFGRPDEHYLLAEADPEAFGRALERLLHDAALRRRLGAAARDWAMRELAVERSLDRYADLYRDLAAGRDRPAGD